MIGQRVGRYLLEGLHAAGGMGETYLAHASDLRSEAPDARDGDRRFLIKLPAPALLGSAEARARFEREAATLRRLDHPNVQRLVETGAHALRPFIALEYVEGETLRAVLQRRGPLPPDDAVTITLTLAGALGYCHAHGVVHRDLKPENVVLTLEGRPVVVDFGAALLEGARRLTFASLSGELGTPEYMAPEQVRGERGDARSDVYALATLLYELLTGRPPFAARPGDTAVHIMRRHLEEWPPPPAVPALPPALFGVLRRALQRDPAARFPTMAAFATALTDPQGAVTRGDVVPGWRTDDDAAPHPAQPARAPRKRLRYAVVTIAALLALAALGVAASLLGGASQPLG